MKFKILIVEDQFIEANNLKMILENAGYEVCGIAASVVDALHLMEHNTPHMVMLDIHLRGPLSGIDLADKLIRRNIAFVYLSANSNRQTLDAAKVTRPYGFLVKPFRERDVLIMLEVALYRCRTEQQGIVKTEQQGQPKKKESSPPAINIIGQSKVFLDVLEQVKIVAESETSVLILGETGTGKEVIARDTHQLSERRNKPFIALNCAALPPNLIESELFGHEKGSFTGALEKRVGKFEQANGGTIFLDEIGELPLDLQSKFLRVLQEREIEPIGGTRKTIDVRVIAATNRNLEQEMSNGRFRMDLFYRLNVFPISLPPLRERKEDILLLADFFIGMFANRMNKPVKGLSEAAKSVLLQYTWPGNIRELENIMERSVILSKSGQIHEVPLSTLQRSSDEPVSIGAPVKTITENQKEHILAALEKCGWRLHGAAGAAKMLDINPSTLLSRMKKLGIKR
ncbi:MAG TPA: sigma-54 dependent transcriptional regulator [Puia sp.]|jgi:DNA-binding NtrC family response regulator